MQSFGFASVVVIALIGLVDAQTPTAVLDVLAYNDVYELKQDNVSNVFLGGPSRVITLAHEMRAKNPTSLVLLAGDTMSPSLWSNQFKGLQMIDAHNAIGLDFACLGNHEFDFGIDSFYKVAQASKFPWLNANAYEIGTNDLLRGTVPNAVKEFGNLKVGLFGVMYDMKEPSTGLRWTDPIEAAKEQVKILREEKKVDLVIALTHQDFADDSVFANSVEGVDIIYGGHDHNNMKHLENKVPYFKADLNFRTIWRSTIEYFADSKSTKMSHELVTVEKNAVKSNKAFDGKIQEYEETIKKLYDVNVGTLCEEIDLEQQNVRTKEMPVGNFFADVCRHEYGVGTDLGLWNGGNIRTDKKYPAGPVNLGTLIAWSPFGNTVLVLELDGANLKKYVTSEMSEGCDVGGKIKQNGFYVHSSNFKYTFQCTGEQVGQLLSIEYFNHPTRYGPILDTDVFKLGISEYLYHTKFKPVAKINRMVVGDNEAIRIESAITNYLNKLPDKNICPKLEGRNTYLAAGDNPAPTTSAVTTPGPTNISNVTQRPPPTQKPHQLPPSQSPPTQSPPTQKPTTPIKAPPSQVPSTQAPPTQAPPTQSPPTQAAPNQAPPTQKLTTPTQKPSEKPTPASTGVATRKPSC